MRALEILLERRWILKSREKELYYQIKDELGTVKKFLMEKLGYTEEEAAQELEEIKQEGSISADVFDFAQASAQEGMNPNEEPEAQEERESEAEDES